MNAAPACTMLVSRGLAVSLRRRALCAPEVLVLPQMMPLSEEDLLVVSSLSLPMAPPVQEAPGSSPLVPSVSLPVKSSSSPSG